MWGMANRCLGIDSTNHQCTRDAGDKFLCAKHKDQEVIAGGATVGDMFEERTLLIRDGENVHIQPEGAGVRWSRRRLCGSLGADRR
jgi:hypothetical protein